MPSPKINKMTSWWLSPKFPEKHIENILNYKPSGFRQQIRNLWRTWVVHPIKRRLAKYYLVLLKKYFGLKVIAITGSAGKTTTKEMLASILQSRGQTIFSYANIDPVYNIPTTILRCSPKTKYLVLEMGVEFPGEMDFYLWLAKPDIGVITNIYPTHTQFFGDVHGVFAEKSKLVTDLKVHDVAVLNHQNSYLRSLDNKLQSKIVWFGDGTEVESSLVEIDKYFRTRFLISFDKKKDDILVVNLSALGYQYVLNALAAAGTSRALGINVKNIKRGLESFSPPPHRMSVIMHKSGAVIIDDTYNNNPEAAKSSLDTFFAASKGKERIIVFGDMKELGRWEKKYHEDIGKYITKHIKPSKLMCVGVASKKTASVASRNMSKNNVSWFVTSDEVRKPLLKLLNSNAVVLVKGSRSIGLDRLVLSL